MSWQQYADSLGRDVYELMDEHSHTGYPEDECNLPPRKNTEGSGGALARVVMSELAEEAAMEVRTLLPELKDALRGAILKSMGVQAVKPDFARIIGDL